MRYFFLILILPFSLYAQQTLKLSANSEEAKLRNFLLQSSSSIQENALLNHQLVDLVEAYTIDSVFNRSFERHRVFGGGIIRLLGYRWKAVDNSRVKIVGWVNRHYLHDEDDQAHFTEYDINYDLIPTLPKYVDLAYNTYQDQFNMKKSKKKDEAGMAPYIYPTAETDMTKYRFHCENTLPIDFRSLMNTFFFPVHRNNDLNVHPNFENEHPVMGMYGVLVLDCNHSCHPEIHPYEWAWWLNLTEEKPSWNIGFMRDVSNRFKHWSAAPRTGEIAIPFAFPLYTSEWTLKIDHQMFGNFSRDGFKDLRLPANVFDFSETERNFAFEDIELKDKSIKVISNIKVPYQSLVYYLSDLQYDEDKSVVSGIFHLAMSISEVYTATLKMEYKENETDLSQLLRMMQGSFSSKEQAAKDTSFFDINLHMYPIWQDRTDAKWLYVEQSLSAQENSPYRQRIYKVRQIDAASFISEIYLLPNDNLAIGQWKNPSFFNQWTPEDLTLKEGCAVYLKKSGPNTFEGGTFKGTCESSLHGANYATSKVKITEAGLDSWDQGFDADGKQVWGAEKGGYLFRR